MSFYEGAAFFLLVWKKRELASKIDSRQSAYFMSLLNLAWKWSFVPSKLTELDGDSVNSIENLKLNVIKLFRATLMDGPLAHHTNI